MSNVEMGNFLELILNLVKEPRRCYRGNRVNWRKVISIIAITTTAGVVLQMHALSSELSNMLLISPIRVSSNSVPNSNMHVKSTTIPRPTLDRLSPVSSTISQNSTAKKISSRRVVKKRAPRIKRRRGRKHPKKRNTEDYDFTGLPEFEPPKIVLPMEIASLPPDDALIYAKKEIGDAPLVNDDPDLYAPLFHNISYFRRSYDLMESMLKVYIYKDGQRPIFHEPQLSGIYASEGWFLKLMEENKQFVTPDAGRAHLFYLPYSARQLELALYVPDSHNLKPLSIFLRDYINWIASKYPFWNRTRGSDHFLVACHDWGPYTVTAHEELLRNTIKALCNADLSERIFVEGRDISLPETTIRRPRRPRRDIGGNRVSQRPILAFFAGNMHGRVRPILLKHWSDKDEDMRIYGPLPDRISSKMSYGQHMKNSKFCICPMGYEVNSPRIVEAIYNECVPVIIADNFVLPFSEVLDWSAFSVVVAEKDIPKLKEILLGISMRQYLKMQTNIKMVQKHFLWSPRPVRYDLFHMILHSIWLSRLNHIQIQ